MKWKFEYNKSKNVFFKETRGIGFEEVIDAIGAGGLLVDVSHPLREKYSRQRLLIVMIDNYAWAVPYVRKSKNCLFLKTAYPSRKMTKKILKVARRKYER